MDFSKLSALVVGDVMVDAYSYGEVIGTATEAPCPIFKLQRIMHFVPGAAANVARSIAHLGARAHLISAHEGTLQDDYIFHITPDGKPCTELIEDAGRVLTTKVRHIDGEAQVFRCDLETKEPLGDEVAELMAKMLEERLCKEHFDAVIVSDYGKGVVTQPVMDAIRDMRSEYRLLAVDPAARPFAHYGHVDLLTPSAAEFKALWQDPKGYTARSVVITEGQDGMSCGIDGEHFHTPAYNRRPLCVVGAGDCVVAGLTLLLLEGVHPKDAMQRVSFAVGRAVGRPFTSYLKKGELDDDIRARREADDAGDQPGVSGGAGATADAGGDQSG